MFYLCTTQWAKSPQKKTVLKSAVFPTRYVLFNNWVIGDFYARQLFELSIDKD